MKNKKYWEYRSKLREASYQLESKRVTKRISKAYDRAFLNLETKIEKIENSITKNDVNIDPKIFRIKHLESIQKDIYSEFKNLANLEHKITSSRYKELIKDSYYKTIFDIQLGLNFEINFHKISLGKINTLLKSKWAGSNFSKRIYKNTAKTAQRAYEIISAGFMSGASIKDMGVDLRRLENVSKYVSERLIRTETNYYSNQAELLSYEECGIVNYRYLATLDLNTSKLCQSLDNKVFSINKAIVGRNYPPMHPNCRSTTVAVIEDEELITIKRRGRNKDVKPKLFDADTNYKDWYRLLNSVDKKI